MEKKKRSIGVMIFGILMILGALIQLPGNLEMLKLLSNPLPEIIVVGRYYLIKLLLILGIAAGVGILCLKNIFRKIALFTSAFVIFDYLIELPFFALRNIPNFIEQQVKEIIAKSPMIPASALSSILWTTIVMSWIIDFGFSLCVIYFFTRPKVKEQFK